MAHEDISGYSLRRGLGSGSVGTVWLLRDLATGRHAVLKRIPKAAVAVKSDFLGDLDLARTIDHPHVARLLEVRESDREWLLFSQYVAAGTLTSLLERRGALSPGELVTLISPLAQGLSALHRSGLTHGHLGRGDIMFDADGRPVITDAGLRTQAPPSTPEADLAALEVIAHESGGDPKTFPPSLFTTTGDLLAQQALHRAHPLPINLSFKDNHQTHTVSHPTPDASPSPPTTPHPTPAATPTPPTSSTTPTSHRSAAPPTLPGSPAAPTSPAAPASHGSLATPTSHTSPATPSHGSSAALTSHSSPAAPRSPGSPTALGSQGSLASPTSQGSPAALISHGSLATPTSHGSGATPSHGSPATPSHGSSAALTSHGSSVAPPFSDSSDSRASGAVASVRGSGHLPRPTHRRPVNRQSGGGSGRRSAGQALRQLLRTKRAAYGILAACGAGALATLVIGLVTLGVPGHPATGSTAAADPSPQPTPHPKPTTPQSSQATSHPKPITPQPSQASPHPKATTPQPSQTTSQPKATTAQATPHPKPTTPHRSLATSVPTRAADSAKWLQTLQALDARRSRAFATLNLADLNAVYVPGSSPWAADRALLASYRDQHLRIEGLRLQIESVSVETPGKTTIVLRIVDRLASGVAITTSGQRTAFPPGERTARRLTLTAAATSWRISSIAKA